MPGSSLHVLDYYMELLKRGGVRELVYRYNLCPEEGAQQRADDILRGHGVCKRFAVLITGSARSEKCWPLDKFAAIAKLLNDRYGLNAVTVGSKSEYETNGGQSGWQDKHFRAYGRFEEEQYFDK
jgi:ADP-heptose:LPS heptosyltransferase